MWILIAILVGLAVLFIIAAMLFEIDGAWLGAGATVTILVVSYGSVLLVRKVVPEPSGHLEPIVMASAAIIFCIAVIYVWRLVTRRRRADDGQRRQ
jgi:hypothetical protein